MGVHFDSSEVRALGLNLAAAPGRIQRAAPRAIRKTALDIERDAKILAPVDTGALKASIGSDIRQLEAEISATTDYAVYVEHGTSRMAAQPYMGPSFDRNIPGLQRALGDAGEDSVL